MSSLCGERCHGLDESPEEFLMDLLTCHRSDTRFPQPPVVLQGKVYNHWGLDYLLGSVYVEKCNALTTAMTIYFMIPFLLFCGHHPGIRRAIPIPVVEVYGIQKCVQSSDQQSGLKGSSEDFYNSGPSKTSTPELAITPRPSGHVPCQRMHWLQVATPICKCGCGISSCCENCGITSSTWISLYIQVGVHPQCIVSLGEPSVWLCVVTGQVEPHVRHLYNRRTIQLCDARSRADWKISRKLILFQCFSA